MKSLGRKVLEKVAGITEKARLAKGILFGGAVGGGMGGLYAGVGGNPHTREGRVATGLGTGTLVGAGLGAIHPVLGAAAGSIAGGVRGKSTGYLHQPTINRFLGSEKAASIPGQDLRLPITGGTKFPTKDSIAGAQKLLNQSKGRTEVGPSPKMTQIKPTGPTIQQIAPKTSPSTAGSIPKLGGKMSIQNDPLVKYLKKQAAELEDNKADMPLGKQEPELSTEDPKPDEQSKDRMRVGMALLSQLFQHTGAVRAKCHEKDHPAKAGEVNKVLKKK